MSGEVKRAPLRFAQVTAFEVDHDPVKPAFGFRVDYGGRSVVLSGGYPRFREFDSTRAGSGLAGPRGRCPGVLRRTFPNAPAEILGRIVSYHVMPEQAGEVFARTKPYSLKAYDQVRTPQATAESPSRLPCGTPGTTRAKDVDGESGEIVGTPPRAPHSPHNFVPGALSCCQAGHFIRSSAR